MTDSKNNIDFELLLKQPDVYLSNDENAQELIRFVRQRTSKFLKDNGKSDQTEQKHYDDVFQEFFTKITAIKTQVDQPERYANRTLTNVMTDLLTSRTKLEQNTQSIEGLANPNVIEEQNYQESVDEHGDEIPEPMQLFRAWLVYAESMEAELNDMPLKLVVNGVRKQLLENVNNIKKQFQQLVPDSRERNVSILLCFSQFEWTPKEISKHLEISVQLISITQNKVKDKFGKFISKLDQ